MACCFEQDPLKYSYLPTSRKLHKNTDTRHESVQIYEATTWLERGETVTVLYQDKTNSHSDIISHNVGN